jgi:uncharacterized membrane protein YwzB
MTNERYVIVSYFICAALSAALGTLVYLFLRRPFVAIADAVSRKHLASTLKSLFPFGLLLPALLGFISVSYWSCQRATYEEIVQSQRYLVEKNQEQISSTLFSVLVAVLVWDFIILLVSKYAQRGSKES